VQRVGTTTDGQPLVRLTEPEWEILTGLHKALERGKLTVSVRRFGETEVLTTAFVLMREWAKACNAAHDLREAATAVEFLLQGVGDDETD